VLDPFNPITVTEQGFRVQIQVSNAGKNRLCSTVSIGFAVSNYNASWSVIIRNCNIIHGLSRIVRMII